MFPTPDFDSTRPRRPPGLPHLPAHGGAPGSHDSPAAFISELYAAAWAQAQRDYELDRLFNAEFYQGGEI
jgi:hypothetical protein